MSPRPTPTSPLSQSLFVAREIAREVAESAASVGAAAAETCAASKRLVAESRAAREARHVRAEHFDVQAEAPTPREEHRDDGLE